MDICITICINNKDYLRLSLITTTITDAENQIKFWNRPLCAMRAVQKSVAGNRYSLSSLVMNHDHRNIDSSILYAAFILRNILRPIKRHDVKILYCLLV